jgi:hypothetical protein
MADVGWIHGDLIEPPIEAPPDVPVAEMTEVLENAESIVNSIAEDAVAEARARDEKAAKRRRFRKRR